MTMHMKNSIRPIETVCGQEHVPAVSDIDHVDCVDCLRKLAKDAVIYGVGRRPSRKW